MKVRVTRSYLWAEDGIRVRTVEAGEILDGEGAEIALQMGCGEALDDGEEKAAPPAETKALPKAPKNKARG